MNEQPIKAGLLVDKDYAFLMTGPVAINPATANFRRMNTLDAGNNECRLLHACLCAYAKFAMDWEGMSDNEVIDLLCDVICNTAGPDAYCQWVERMGMEGMEGMGDYE